MIWLDNLIENVIIKRVVAMLVHSLVAYGLAHCGIFDAIGISIQIQPEKMNDALTVLFMANIEQFRHYLATKYPSIAWL